MTAIDQNDVDEKTKVKLKLIVVLRIDFRKLLGTMIIPSEGNFNL